MKMLILRGKAGYYEGAGLAARGIARSARARIRHAPEL
jgi:hypothetical protein